MKQKLLTLLCGVSIGMLPIQFASAQAPASTNGNVKLTFETPSPAKVQATKDQKDKEKMTQMATLYGLSFTQTKRWLEINKERDQKLGALNKSNISPDVKKQQAAAIVNTHDQKLKAILTPGQYAKFEAIRAKNNTIAAKQWKIIREYRKANSELRSIEPTARKAAHEKLLQQYAIRLKKEMPNGGNAKDLLREPARNTIAASPLTKHLNLSTNQINELAKLQEARQWKQVNLEKKKLTPAENNALLKQINQNYETRVKEILGPDKYIQRAAFLSKSHERKFKTYYGFTDADYSQYKRIENEVALEIMFINNSNLTPVQKEAKIAELREAKAKSLKSILPAAQYQKWHSAVEARKAAAKANQAKKAQSL